GGSAHQLLRAVGDRFNAWFDVYALEPRGVAGPQAATCDPAAEAAFRRADGWPESVDEQRELEAAARAVAASCSASSSPLLPNMTTEDAVADLDVARASIGAPTLTWMGFSYGTLVGLRYAERFPERVRALVL